MTPADRKTLTLMLNIALDHEGTLAGTLDGREGALLNRRCERTISRFKACAARLVDDAEQLAQARRIIHAYLGTAGLRPKKDIIAVDERARAWLTKNGGR